MKYLLILAITLLPVLAHAQRELPRLKQPKQRNADKDVWDVTDNEGFWIHYEQPKEVLETFEKQAKLKMWSAEQRAQEQAKLPAGGWLTARLVGSMTEADPHVLTFIIQDAAGAEIFRYQPESRPPQTVVSAQHGLYKSEVAIPLERALGQDYRVFVVHEARQVRYEYLIRPL